MSNKTLWVDEIKAVANDFVIDTPRLDLESPQFTYGQWRIGIEHQRKFKSIVLKWLGVSEDKPCPVEDWAICPDSDQEKGWSYRVQLEPQALRSLLVSLNSHSRSEASWRRAFESQVRRSEQDSSQIRRDRLAQAPKVPRKVEVTTTVFERNPDVVVEVLLRANGTCEACNATAPFVRRSDGSPYLEVHHRTPLSVGGEDTVENAIALCPNCHRRAHYA